MIEELLGNLGLSHREVSVYLLLLKHKELTAVAIADKVHYKRPTVYMVLDSLIKRGLVTKHPGKKIDTFLPLPVSNLNNLYTKEERELRKRKELAKRAVLELEQFGSNAVFSIPRTTFVAEEDALDFLYRNTDKWNESMLQRDKTLWGFSTPSYAEAFGEYVEWWSKKAEGVITLKLFSNDSKPLTQLSEKYKHRLIKPWPGTPFSTSMTVQGDYVLIENTAAGPLYLIEIYDKVLAENLREMFRTMWQMV